MKKFSEMDIKITHNGYLGEKIKISKVFNKEIEIHSFKEEPSKKNESILLTIQIKFENELRVIFCGSQMLHRILKLVPVEDFPFIATIVNDNNGYSLQ